ncbi:LamG-like jellyroll fold domain-containing protein [Corynebacterium sp. A21]|uniref:LamG-like jellyroll fold domain-containing protein n=1 Tax=Corynebacterium sp. A21 TaxID=3457318 RepID=UPI003FD521DA
MTDRRVSARPYIASVLVAALAFGGTVAVAQAQDAELGSRFTLGVMPDTQFYSRYSTPDTGNLYEARYGSEPFATQASWLVDNQDELNIPFTTHLGDVVDQSTVTQEWEVADRSMQILEDGGMNYSVLPGNHDILRDAAETPFSEYFSAERAAQNDTFGDRYGAANNESEFHIFEAEGQEYLVLALAWRADEGALAWAQSVIDAHPELPVILTAHEISNIDADGEIFLSDSYGQGLWDTFISKNDQIFLTISGHHHGAGYRIDRNDAGHEVVNVLQDNQMAYQGGNGILGLIQFDLSANSLDMTALSPWVAAKPAETLNQFDHLIPEGSGDSWSVDMDFAERFAGFNADWTIGEADDPDYAAKAREIVSAGYLPPAVTEGDLPQDAQDYPKVADTAVHWRPGATTVNGEQATEGQAAGPGAVIPDIAGGNDLVRAELNTRGAAGSQAEDVTWVADAHELSSDTGSLKWVDPAENSQRLNWFETTADAAINEETFEEGYTFETFLKIDENFDGDNHWMGAISRQGERGELAENMPEGEEPPAALAVSSLRELQWTNVAIGGNGDSNWSHEVPKGEWLHVAIVNDPDTDTVEMFVNGAPILRDVLDSQGLESTGDAWLIGANMWDADPANPWFGQVGETRIVHGAIGQDQWLTARAEDSLAPPAGSSTGSSTGGLLGLFAALGGIAAGAVALFSLDHPALNQVKDQLRAFGLKF